jgi:hypothetical protein
MIKKEQQNWLNTPITHEEFATGMNSYHDRIMEEINRDKNEKIRSEELNACFMWGMLAGMVVVTILLKIFGALV